MPSQMDPGAFPRIRRWALAVGLGILPLLALAWILHGPLLELDRGLWGPADPWSNGDFVGNFWCWWRTAEVWQTGTEWIDRLGWPEGGENLWTAFPNRLDAAFVAPWFEPDAFVTWWNGMAVVHLAGAIVATVLAARLAGATPLAAAIGASILALSPTLLHELAGGRMATFIVWPGILAMGCWQRAAQASRLRGRVGFAVLAGVALALQAYGYAFHALGVATAIVVIFSFESGNIVRRAGIVGIVALTAGIAVGPYAWRLVSMSSEFARIQPPAGYTSLPIAGLVGLSSVPERFRCMPLFLPAVLVSLGSRPSRPWALAALVVGVMALGPTLRWDMSTTLGPGPLSWVFSAVHLVSRMHHPLRLAPFALAAGGVAFALFLDTLGARGWRLGRWGILGGVVMVGIALAAPMQRVTSWRMPALPRGVAAARWLGDEGDGAVLDVYGGRHIASLSLQPWHHRPVLETAEGRIPPPGARWTGRARIRLAAVDALAEGRDVDGALWQDLRDAGFTTILLVERPTLPVAPETRSAVRAKVAAVCGAPVFEDPEAVVFRLP